VRSACESGRCSAIRVGSSPAIHGHGRRNPGPGYTQLRTSRALWSGAGSNRRPSTFQTCGAASRRGRRRAYRDNEATDCRLHRADKQPSSIVPGRPDELTPRWATPRPPAPDPVRGNGPAMTAMRQQHGAKRPAGTAEPGPFRYMVRHRLPPA
jgi:hypothetical protein